MPDVQKTSSQDMVKAAKSYPRKQLRETLGGWQLCRDTISAPDEDSQMLWDVAIAEHGDLLGQTGW
jgi:hypothetical protein